MPVRTNGGVFNDQMLTGSLKYFTITGADFSKAVDENGTPVHNSAAENVYTIVSERATVVIMNPVTNDLGMSFALETGRSDWDETRLQTAIRSLGVTGVDNIDLSNVTVEEGEFDLLPSAIVIQGSFIGLSDTPDEYVAGNFLKVNDAGTALEFTSATSGGIEEAPEDGQQYARQNANWTVVTGGSGGGNITSVFGRTGIVSAIEGDYNLDLMGDVEITAPSNDQFLRFQDGEWVNETVGAIADPVIEFSNYDARFFGELGLPTGQNWVTSGDSTLLSVTDDIVFGTNKQVVKFSDDGSDILRVEQNLTAQDWLDIQSFGATFSGISRLDALDGEEGFFIGLQADASENPINSGDDRYGMIFENINGFLRVGSQDTPVNATMDGTNGNPLVDPTQWFEYVVNVPPGLGTATLSINGQLTTYNVPFETNTGGKGTRIVISTGSSPGTNRLSYHDNYGVTIFRESPIKLMNANDFTTSVTKIVLPPGEGDYTLIFPTDLAPRDIGATLVITGKNIGGSVTFTNQDLANSKALINGFNTSTFDVIKEFSAIATNTVDQGNVYSLSFDDYREGMPNNKDLDLGTGNIISSGATIAGITYPTIDGTNGQSIVTDGLGNLTFQTVSGGAGSATFIELTDTPVTFVGQAEKGVKVNSTEDGLEFFDRPTVIVTEFNGRSGSVLPIEGDYSSFYATTAQGALADSALQSGNNISELSNDAGYITVLDVPDDAVISVDGRAGIVTLADLYAPIVHTHVETDITDLDKYTQAEVDAKELALQGSIDSKADSVHTHVKLDITDFSDADYATAAQGALADSALQSGNNISELSNDANYISDITSELISDLSDVSISEINTGQILEWDGAQFIPGDKTPPGSGITDIIEDTTPQLGGDLDVNDFSIKSGTGQNLDLRHATGNSVFINPDPGDADYPDIGNLALAGLNESVLRFGTELGGLTISRGEIRLNRDGRLSLTGLQELRFVSPSFNVNDAYTIPVVDGTANQVLTTDGAGLVSWQDQSGSGSVLLDDLDDVIINAPVVGNRLRFDGTNWVNSVEITEGASTTNLVVVYTADQITTAEGNFYVAANNDGGTTQTGSITASSEGTDANPVAFDQDFLGEIFPEEAVFNAGEYTAIVSTSFSGSGSGSSELTLELYLADVDGAVVDSGSGEPIGSLGVSPIKSTNVQFTDNTNAREISLRTFTNQDTVVPSNHRVRHRFLANKTGTVTPRVFTITIGANYVSRFITANVLDLGEINDVTLTESLVNGEALRYDETAEQWVNRAITLSSLEDVDPALAPSDLQVLKYNETTGQWFATDEAVSSTTSAGYEQLGSVSIDPVVLELEISKQSLIEKENITGLLPDITLSTDGDTVTILKDPSMENISVDTWDETQFIDIGGSLFNSVSIANVSRFEVVNRDSTWIPTVTGFGADDIPNSENYDRDVNGLDPLLIGSKYVYYEDKSVNLPSYESELVFPGRAILILVSEFTTVSINPQPNELVYYYPRGTITSDPIVLTGLNEIKFVYNGTHWDAFWTTNFNIPSPLASKGDLLVYSTDEVRLPVGQDGQILTADSTASEGMRWKEPETKSFGDGVIDGGALTGTVNGFVDGGSLA